MAMTRSAHALAITGLQLSDQVKRLEINRNSFLSLSPRRTGEVTGSVLYIISLIRLNHFRFRLLRHHFPVLRDRRIACGFPFSLQTMISNGRDSS